MLDGKIVLYGQENPRHNGCNLYRLRQPFAKIIDKDLIPCALSSMLDLDGQAAWLDKADVIFTKTLTPKLLEFMAICKRDKTGQKFVIDVDDNIFAVSPFNPSYLRHGTEEVDYTLPDGSTKRLRDGEAGFDLKANRDFIKNFAECVKYADLVLTPSPILSGFLKGLNKNVKVVRNFLDFGIWNPLPLVKDETVRIVWQGGDAHFEDWCLIEDALEIVMNKYKNVKLIVMGTKYEAYLKNIPLDQIQFEGWVDIDVYPHKFKTLNADIGICPLENNLFNTCKSELKWTEYSALGIATCASNVPPYSLNIRHGRTGLLCKDTKEWVENLSLLIESKADRERIANAAIHKVRDEYNLDSQINKYVEVFEGLYKKELVIV